MKKKEPDKSIPNDLFQDLFVKNYINLNGKIIDSNEPVLLSSNRSFRYGDALFETIRIAKGTILFLNDHIKRLTSGMKYLKMELRQEFSISLLGRQIVELALKNNIKTDGRIRLTIFRNQDGNYMPEINSVSYLIEAEKMEEKGFIFNTKGYSIDIFPDIKKSQNKLSNIKSANALTFVLAGIFKKENQLDEAVILNESGNITEGISSNVFAIKENIIFTPPLTEGCIDGIMRQKIIKTARANQYTVYETPLLPDFLNDADEVFFTNMVKGVKWAGAFKTKRYYSTISKVLNQKLNDSLQ